MAMARPQKAKKQKYLITLPNDELFAFAGLWSEWVNKETAEVVKTFTIVTTEANGLMSEIHNSKKRMPVILDKETETEWLIGMPLFKFEKPEIELKATEI